MADARFQDLINDSVSKMLNDLPENFVGSPISFVFVGVVVASLCSKEDAGNRKGNK